MFDIVPIKFIFKILYNDSFLPPNDEKNKLTAVAIMPNVKYMSSFVNITFFYRSQSKISYLINTFAAVHIKRSFNPGLCSSCGFRS